MLQSAESGGAGLAFLNAVRSAGGSSLADLACRPEVAAEMTERVDTTSGTLVVSAVSSYARSVGMCMVIISVLWFVHSLIVNWNVNDELVVALYRSRAQYQRRDLSVEAPPHGAAVLHAMILPSCGLSRFLSLCDCRQQPITHHATNLCSCHYRGLLKQQRMLADTQEWTAKAFWHDVMELDAPVASLWPRWTAESSSPWFGGCRLG